MLWWTLKQCKSQDVSIRLQACKKLAEIRDPHEVARLLATYKGFDVEEPSVGAALIWESAALAIAKMGRPAMPPLLEALKHHDPKMRAAAAILLGNFKDPGVRDALKRALKDEDNEVRERVKEALAKMGQSEAVETAQKADRSMAPVPVEPLPNSVVIFREGADEPSNPLAYIRNVFGRKYKCDNSKLALATWRIVGVRDDFDAAFATTLYAQLKRTGQLPELGPVSDRFEGKGSDGRTVVAFFFGEAPAKIPAKTRVTEDFDHPVCTSCGKSLGPGRSVLSGAVILSDRPAGEVQDDYTLFTGSVCFNCQAVFCVECLAGCVDRCPKCQGATKPAYRRHLRELVSLVS